MPEPIRSEEDVNRQQSLCLFNETGITNLNRCSQCPGATRSPLQHRRCPYDAAQPNIFLRDPVDPVKSLASSSSSKVPEAEWLSVGALSLADSTATETSSDTPDVPSQDVGSKRKVDDILRYQTTEDDLKNRAPVPFKDFPDSNPYKRMHQLMRISEENHEAASSSMTTAMIPDFSLDINKPGVRASCHDTEIDGTQMR